MGYSEEVNDIKDELKWISEEENSKSRSRGIIGVLIPIGCFVTTGILMSGLYQFIKRNREKQQRLMRYRVLAQGITAALTVFGIFKYKS